jgi:hypothetical protein
LATPRPGPDISAPSAPDRASLRVGAGGGEPLAPLGEDATGDVRILGPVAAPVRVVPVFRAGLVETAQGPAAPRSEPSTPGPNGQARERPPGERRARPLRAT